MSICAKEINDSVKFIEKIENAAIKTRTDSLIRVEIAQSVSRQVVICLQFPKNYPNEILLLELKSKFLSGKFLENLVSACEKKLKIDYVGEPQILPVINLVNEHLKRTPLCVVYDEIKKLQKHIEQIPKSEGDLIELLVKQKTSTVRVNFESGNYYFKVNVEVPEEYPLKSVTWGGYTSNLPMVMTIYIDAHAKEIARRCVEPPAAQNAQTFQPQPSLYQALLFLIDVTKQYSSQSCPVCGENCLPSDPVHVVSNDKDGKFIERLICGHLYHQECLLEFISEPPFKGKTCKLANCLKPVMHHRWGENIAKAESRWAARESRKRELQDVMDFLN